jgi:hypothetical protein
MIRIGTVGLVLLIGIMFASAAHAQGYPWRDHAKPYSFLLGNNIDTHQQTRLGPDGELDGWLYVTDTGEEIDGVPVKRHCNSDTPAKDCEAGWKIRGVPGAATFVFKGMDHPIFLVFSRNDIPQPGAYSHFHWLNGPNKASGLVEGVLYDGYFLELQATQTFVFRFGGGDILVRQGLDTSTHVNVVGSFPQ